MTPYNTTRVAIGSRYERPLSAEAADQIIQCRRPGGHAVIWTAIVLASLLAFIFISMTAHHTAQDEAEATASSVSDAQAQAAQSLKGAKNGK